MCSIYLGVTVPDVRSIIWECQKSGKGTTHKAGDTVSRFMPDLGLWVCCCSNAGGWIFVILFWFCNFYEIRGGECEKDARYRRNIGPPGVSVSSLNLDKGLVPWPVNPRREGRRNNNKCCPSGFIVRVQIGRDSSRVALTAYRFACPLTNPLNWLKITCVGWTCFNFHTPGG